MKLPDLSGVDSWAGGTPILPPGTHDVTIIEGEEGTAGTGTPQWVLKMSNDNGQITDWVAITPKTFGRVKGILEAAGIQIPQGEFEFVPSGLVNKRVSIFVQEEPKQDGSGMRSKVKGYGPPSDGKATGELGGPNPIGNDGIPF